MAKARPGFDVLGLMGNRKAAPAKASTDLVAAPAPGGQEKKIEAPYSASLAQEESLVERVLKSRGHVKPEEARDELASLHAALQDVSKKTVVLIFALGKVLAEVKAELPHGDFLPWIEENCDSQDIHEVLEAVWPGIDAETEKVFYDAARASLHILVSHIALTQRGLRQAELDRPTAEIAAQCASYLMR